MTQYAAHKWLLWAVFGVLVLLMLAGCDVRDVFAGASEGAAAGAATGNPWNILIYGLIGAFTGGGAENIRKRKHLKIKECLIKDLHAQATQRYHAENNQEDIEPDELSPSSN